MKISPIYNTHSPVLIDAAIEYHITKLHSLLQSVLALVSLLRLLHINQYRNMRFNTSECSEMQNVVLQLARRKKS